MRTFFILFTREVKAFFYTPIAYVVLFYFLILTGFNFYSEVMILNRGPVEVTVVEAFFDTIIFWFSYVLLFPLITMRLFSDEFRMGTFETLTTAPVRDWQVVLSKFFGALLFYVVLWLPSLLYFVIFQWVAHSDAARSPGSYWGAYLLLFLMGCFYISIGCLASVLTKDQINAAVISFTSITLWFFAGLLTFIFGITAPVFKDIISYISAVEHMSDFSKGIIDSRPLVWYSSMTVLMLVLTYHVFQFRKWKA